MKKICYKTGQMSSQAETNKYKEREEENKIGEDVWECVCVCMYETETEKKGE